MNTDNNKTFQDILLEFSQTPKIDVVGFTKKYEEVLTAFLGLDEIYTVNIRKLKRVIILILIEN